MKQLLITSLLLVLSLAANAEMSGDGTITQINQSNYSNVLRIDFSKDIVQMEQDGVQCSTDYYLLNLKDDARSERLFSIILAAQMSNKKVNFYLNGCIRQTSNRPLQPKIQGVYLK